MQECLYTGNTAGIRFPYFRNWVTSRALVKETGPMWPVFPPLFQKASISCTWYDPSLFVVLKIKCLLESCLEEDVHFFRIPHHTCISFPYLSPPPLCRLQLWKRQTHVVEQCCQIFLPFYFMSTEREGIWKCQFYTYTHGENFILIWVMGKVAFYTVLLYQSFHLTF